MRGTYSGICILNTQIYSHFIDSRLTSPAYVSKHLTCFRPYAFFTWRSDVSSFHEPYEYVIIVKWQKWLEIRIHNLTIILSISLTQGKWNLLKLLLWKFGCPECLILIRWLIRYTTCNPSLLERSVSDFHSVSITVCVASKQSQSRIFYIIIP